MNMDDINKISHYVRNEINGMVCMVLIDLTADESDTS